MAGVNLLVPRTDLLEPQVTRATENDGHSDHLSEHTIATNGEPVPDSSASALVVQPPFSVFSHRQKFTAVYVVSLVAVVSPLAGTMYYPALPILARDFGVSDTTIQLTITVYQVRSTLGLSITRLVSTDRNANRSSRASLHP